MKLLSMKDDQDSSDWKTENGLEPAKLRLNNGLKSIDKVLSKYLLFNTQCHCSLSALNH